MYTHKPNNSLPFPKRRNLPDIHIHTRQPTHHPHFRCSNWTRTKLPPFKPLQRVNEATRRITSANPPRRRNNTLPSSERGIPSLINHHNTPLHTRVRRRLKVRLIGITRARISCALTAAAVPAMIHRVSIYLRCRRGRTCLYVMYVPARVYSIFTFSICPVAHGRHIVGWVTAGLHRYPENSRERFREIVHIESAVI